jgi:DNA-binding transcriptional LysR family regulator
VPHYTSQINRATPQDLLTHRLIAFLYWRPESRWTFVHVNGRDEETLRFQPHLSMNDFAGLTPAVRAGGGIGDLPPSVRPELNAGPLSSRNHAKTGASAESVKNVLSISIFPHCERTGGST